MTTELGARLSAKVFAGQCQLAQRGYKLGGPPGYGLRRLLLDSEGTPRRILKTGERKCVATERVTYVAGPLAEVRIVRQIYSLFLESGLTCNAIAVYLNERKIPREGGLRWNCPVVQRILSHAKYIGCVVFNQKPEKLRSKAKRNPQSEWIVTSDCFEPIIAKDRFEAVQARLRNASTSSPPAAY